MITQPNSSGPSSPRLILNSPPLDSPQSLTGNTSYFQPPPPPSTGKPSSKCPVPAPKPSYPPGQGPSTPGKNKPHTQLKGRTPAEVYANQHTALQNTSKRQLPMPTMDHHHTPQKEKEKEKTTKPIFEWISRKLGSRRATISESPSSPSSSNPNYRFPIPSNGSPKLNGNNGNGNGNTRNRIPSMPKPSTRGKSTRGQGGGMVGMSSHIPHHHQIGRQISNVSSNMDNQSLSMISTQSYVGTLERERRREANNPYPSIPIPKLIATGGLKDTIKRRGTSKSPAPAVEDENDGTTISMSFSYSYLSRSPRSRSYSLDSIRSLSRSSYSNSNRRSLDDNISEKDNSRFRRFRGGRDRASTSGTNDRPTSGLGLGGTRPGADDDASLRPFPPSHPASPTPSHSVLSRTGSNPIPLATTSGGNRSRTNTFYSTWSGLGGNNGGRARSFTSSSLDGLYGSTYRYSFDQYNDHDGSGPGPQDEDEEDDEDERGRQSRQDSTSTKPTTCISFDSTPPIAHIAQPQPQPNLQIQTQPQATPGPSTPHQLQTPVATHNGTFGLGDVITTSPMSQAQAGPSASTSPQYHSRDISSSDDNHTPPTPTTPTSASNITTPSSPAHPLILPSHPVHVHVQAPKHTPHHPLHNPIPTEIPDDNASMLTLASSTFGLLPQPTQGQGQATPINPSESPSESHTPTIPQHPSSDPDPDPNTPLIPSAALHPTPSINRLKERESSNKRPSSITSPSIHWAPTPTPLDERPTSTYENNYHYPPSTHASILSVKWADRDASVRAVRRKGSWESYESGWSWRDGNGWGQTGRGVSSPLGEERDRPGSWRSREREGDEGVGGAPSGGGVVVVAN